MTPAQICELYERGKTKMGNLHERWEVIATYANPANRGFNTSFEQGHNVYEDKRDNTMTEAGWKLARSFNTLMTDPATKWFAFKFEDTDLNELDSAKEWLEDSAERLLTELQKSNFQQQMYEAWASYVFYCTFCMDIMDKVGQADDEGWTGLVFKNRHMGNVVALEDANYEPTTIIIEYKLTAQQAEDKFGLEALSRDIQKCIHDNEPDKEFDFIHAMYRREVRNIEDGETPMPDKMPWASDYIELKAKHRVLESGTMDKSRVLARYQTMHGSVYGTGPGLEAIDEAYMISRARELTFDEWEKSIGSPMVTESGNIIGNVNVGSDMITVVADINAIRELRTTRDKGYERFKFDESRQQIRDIFLWDHLDLPRREDIGEMTMFETMKRLEKMFQALGPVTGRAEREGVGPILKSAFNKMLRAGRFKDVPEELLQGSVNTDLTIEYIGPIARAQKMQEIEAVDRLQGELLQKISGGAPENLMDLVDWDAAEREKARRIGVPAKVIRSNDEVEEVRKERAEAEQKRVEMEQAQQGAAALKDANAAGITPENVVQMSQQAQGGNPQ